MTLLQYYRGFGSLYGAFATIPFIPPVLHILAPDSNKLESLYPPLGEMQTLPLAATFVILVVVTYAVLVSCQSASKLHPAATPGAILGAILCFSAVIVMNVLYVREIDVPSVNQEVRVSIGYQRTKFALKTYPDSTDWGMLHDHGPSEETIHLLWTQRSIAIVRVGLWLVYTLSLACLLVVVCVGVYKHVSDDALAGAR